MYRCYTEHDMGYGALEVKAMMAKMKDLGYSTFLVSDHGLSSSFSVMMESQALGLSPMIGLDVEVFGPWGEELMTTLVAHDEAGFRVLSKIFRAYALFDNVDFSGADLSKLDMRYLSAEGCQFDGIDGHELRLESAFLRKTSWIGAKLTEADFRYAALENAFFEEADLRFAKGLDRRMPYGGHYMTAFPKEAMQESDVARLLTMPTFDQDRRKRTILREDDQKNLSIDHRMGFVVGTMAWWEKVLYQRPDLRQQVVLCDVHLPAGSQLVMPLGSDGDFRASSLLIDRIRWEPVV